MHKFVSFNHRIKSVTKTNLSAISSAALFGKGVFTTIGIYNSEPFLWPKHWRRLTENANRLGIDLSDFSSELVRRSLTDLVKKNSLSTGRARLTFFDEKPSQIWAFTSPHKTSLLITTAEFRNVTDIRLIVSGFPINSASPLVNIKSCNYLEHLLAIEEARRRGFDEAVRLNELGQITAGCLANIFWLKDEKIYTPSLKTGCLAGTMREFLLEKFEVFEVEKPLANLRKADGIFLTSAGLKIAGVKQFETRVFNDSKAFLKLKADFAKLLKT